MYNWHLEEVGQHGLQKKNEHHDRKIEFKRTSEELLIELPEGKKPNAISLTLKITKQ